MVTVGPSVYRPVVHSRRSEDFGADRPGRTFRDRRKIEELLMKRLSTAMVMISLGLTGVLAYGEEVNYSENGYRAFHEIRKEVLAKAPVAVDDAYEVGEDDVLEISVIKPQQFDSIVTVAPDG